MVKRKKREKKRRDEQKRTILAESMAVTYARVKIRCLHSSAIIVGIK